MKKSNRKLNSKTKHFVRKNTSNFVLGTMAAAVLPMAVTTVKADEAPSRVSALVDLTIASHYLTPRGMDVVRQGVVFQPMILTFFDLYKSDDFLNDVSLTAGMWNCYATDRQPTTGAGSLSTQTTGWIETDPIAGISFSFAKNFKLSVTYIGFDVRIDNIGYAQNLETKLTFDDTDYLKLFALHPYFVYWDEMSGKAVADTSSNAQSSHYFDVGVAPGYTFEKFYNLRLEAPCRALMAPSQFYGDAAGPTPFVSLYEFGFKASIPLTFMPSGYGHWSGAAGFKHEGFCNPNLRATQNEAGANMFFADISTFF